MIRRSYRSVLLWTLASMICLPAVAKAGGFGVEPSSLGTTYEASKGVIGLPQASSHPYAFTVRFKVNTNGEGRSEGGEMRNLIAELAPGFAGDPFALPRCVRNSRGSRRIARRTPRSALSAPTSPASAVL